MISPLAYIHPEAVIGEGCEIGPFCYIDKNVVIGKNSHLMNSVTLLSGARIGDDNRIFPGAVIGAIPQDLKFKGEETTAEVGDNNTIRENVTINRGTAAKGKTVVGSNNLLMEGMHVAHDAVVGNGCIIGNTTKIAGEVVIDDFAIISACVLIHQFCHVGSYVMVGGGTRTSQDIPPYCMAAREPVAYCGLNLVGLRRRGFSRELIENIHNTYRLLYQRGKLREECLQEIRETVPMSPEIEYILDFITSSKRGIIK
ncbi:acyl-ACP--UDP-N-acetylglucosamine O-acyltransferase [Prevotellamassilia timonensis]|uniref:acyl-ACP--UDP-N-acetylglucosamine O-acyltransferase n=1 Tax=Prevotellamassilia timonensis TaxID=1852370 RepID=UPI003077D10A